VCVFLKHKSFSRSTSDTLEVKAVVPYGQAAVLGVVPGAWLNGVSAVGDEPTPVHSMAEYVELVDSFLGKGVYRGYIKTVRVSRLFSLPSFFLTVLNLFQFRYPTLTL